jgi:bifunctional UDP-N-acetylglucosamine pyrophosphorylase/glucosamine-1-phosphate N-acetyltransferase
VKKLNADFIILAGGLGSRTKTSEPKMFLEIAGRPIIRYIIDLCSMFSARVISVVSPQIENHHLFDGSIRVVQHNAIGTGDAVKIAVSYVKSEYTVIMCADTPLVEPRYIAPLLEMDEDVAFIACKIPDDMLSMPYGRVIFSDDNKFVRIVEYSDASSEEKKNRYINSGIYKIKTSVLLNLINDIPLNCNTGEYYFTELLTILAQNSKPISVIKYEEYWPFHGINTLSDLAIAESIMQNKLREKFMENGVRLLDPASVYFSSDSYVDSNVVIEQNVIIKNGVKIHSGASIRSFCYLENCEIMEHATIGPFARIRDDTSVMTDAIIGNFVEIKKSIIGSEAKVKHLSYVGDTNIGQKSNLGAGTITCNYDGVRKHKSTIGSGVLVGANCSIVSPVKIGDGALLAAGSIITDDVPEKALAISRNRQQNYPNKAEEIRHKKMESNIDE